MANIKSAKKRIGVTEKKTAENRSKKSELNTFIKKYRVAPSAELLSTIFGLLDKAAAENIIHTNKANRLKGDLSKLLVVKK
jgi:small subunit ribosomal protein S20